MPSLNLTGIMDNTKKRFAKGVEIAANFAIIVVALTGAAVLVKNYLLTHSGPPTIPVTEAAAVRKRAAPPAGPAEGVKLSMPGVDWSESNQTILLALSNKCHFCSESAPFYQRLTRELAQRKDVRLVAVFPQETEEAKRYLSDLAVPIADVRQGELASIGVRGTPTLIIVDRTGTIKQSWTGRLSAERESEVLSLIKT